MQSCDASTDGERRSCEAGAQGPQLPTISCCLANSSAVSALATWRQSKHASREGQHIAVGHASSVVRSAVRILFVYDCTAEKSVPVAMFALRRSGMLHCRTCSKLHGPLWVAMSNAADHPQRSPLVLAVVTIHGAHLSRVRGPLVSVVVSSAGSSTAIRKCYHFTEAEPHPTAPHCGTNTACINIA